MARRERHAASLAPCVSLDFGVRGTFWRPLDFGRNLLPNGIHPAFEVASGGRVSLYGSVRNGGTLCTTPMASAIM